MATTAAERKAAERGRRKNAGLVRVELFAHPEDVPAIKESARRLSAARSLRSKRDVSR